MKESGYSITLHNSDGAPMLTVTGSTPTEVLGLYEQMIRHVSMASAFNDLLKQPGADDQPTGETE